MAILLFSRCADRVQISDVGSDKRLFTKDLDFWIFVFLTSAWPIMLIRFPVLYLITPIFKTDFTSSQDICISLVKTRDHYCCFVSSVWLIRFQVLDPNRKRLQTSIVEEIVKFGSLELVLTLLIGI